MNKLKTMNPVPKRLVYLLGTIGFVCLGAHAQEADDAHVRGKMIDRGQVAGQALPASGEREDAAFNSLPVSGLTQAQRKIMSETVLPAAPPRKTTTLDDQLSGTNFESGKDVLLEAARQRLNQLVAQLRGKENIRVQVVGHTDNQRIAASLRPIFANNQALSEARAQAVAAYLMLALKLPATAFSASGKGDSAPVADNRTAAGMASNRRTEIRVWFEESLTVPADPAVLRKVERLVADDSCASQAPQQNAAFSISVDGVPMDTDTAQQEADRQRCVDVALEKAEIQVKYDPLNVTPALNVWLAAPQAVRGAPVPFATYANYAWWIKRAEIRIFARGQNTQEAPLAIVPVAVGASAAWQAPAEMPEQLGYVLRVYDDKGRFDETRVQSLRLLEHADLSAEAPGQPGRAGANALAGWGETNLAIRNIGAAGGSVTISGAKVKPGRHVTALGMAVPVDANGKFAFRQILPAGAHAVDVAVKDADGVGMTFRRNLMIADRDWFYVALADLTVGRDHTTGPAQLVTGDTQHYKNETWVDGRGAFYLKGKIKGDMLLTASADTGDQPLRDLFSNFQSKDPNYLLRRIDPDKYYPVYGDDSTTVDDAPTQGRLYVRLEKGDSSVMWGNFQTAWTGSELAQYSRGLYGANLLWNADSSTPYGEKTSSVNAFAASPGTMQSREEFRGTGGSLYYLHHLDLTQGSERLWLEVRDKDSGLVIGRSELNASQDYEINYMQGRVTLRSPLSSVADGSTLVQSAGLSGNPVYMVATYEYAPGLDAISGSSVGVRGTHWFNEHLRLGASHYHQGEHGDDQTLQQADATLRYKPGTWIKGELARSEGVGSQTFTSQSGGFDFSQVTPSGAPANAKRLDAALDLAELDAALRGRLAGYWQERDAGYSGPGMLTQNGEAMRQAGLAVTLPLGTRTEVALKADDSQATSQDVRSAELSLRHKLDAEWGVSGGLRHDSRDGGSATLAATSGTVLDNASPILSQEGGRSDLVVRVDYRPLQAGQQAKAAALAAQAQSGMDAGGGAVAASGSATSTGAADAATPGGAVLANSAASSAANAAGAATGLRGGPTAGLVTSGRENGMAGGPTLAPDASAAAGIAAQRVAGLLYAPWDMYGFVQHTLSRSGQRADNDRVGLGGSYQVSERLRLGAEASGGDGGPGGQLFGDYQLDERSKVYLNYRMETDSPDAGYTGRQGALTAGTRYRLNEQAGLFAETRRGNGNGQDSLTHAFGVDLAPAEHWTAGVKVETGTISSATAGDLTRRAVGVSAAYQFERLKVSSALEYRTDRTTTLGTVDGTCAVVADSGGCASGPEQDSRHVWLTRNSLSYQLDRDWRLLGKLNLSRSSASQGAFYEGDFTETVAGAAYRPVDNDRWNTLFKYTYFYNLPSPGQVDSITNGTLDYAQKSHILNVDTTYDVRPWLALGGKYGVRMGDLRASKTEGPWFSSRADLMVLRADVHFVKEWDAIVEARRLRAREAGDARSGLLVGVYRHVVEHAKIGVGYNFTTFSDDLTDLSYRSRGWFLNAISTF